MTYPILKTNKARRIGDEIDAAGDSDPDLLTDLTARGFDHEIEHRAGADVDTQALLAAASEFTASEQRLQREARSMKIPVTDAELEMRFAVHLFKTLSSISPKALQDPDFWRYLTLFPYRWVTFRREGNMKPNRYGGDGDRQKSRWTLIRAYTWASKCEDAGDFSYVTRIAEAREEAGLSDGWVIDYYSNNVVRGTMTRSSDLCKSLIDVVLADPPLFDLSNDERPTDDLAQRVRRVSSNYYLPAMDREALSEVIQNEKEYVKTGSASE